MAAGLIDAPSRTTTPAVPAPPGPNLAVVLGAVLSTVAVLALSFVGYALWLSGVQASRGQDLLYDTLRQDLRDGVAPVAGGAPAGTPVGLLRIPSLGVEQVVVEGTASEQTSRGPGHRRDTVLPGQVGTSVLQGRSTTGPRPFGRLDELYPGDEVEVTTGQGRFTYVVDLVRPSSGSPVPIPPAAGRLVLIGSQHALQPDYEVEVYAVLRGQPQPPAGVRPAVDADELPGAGSHGAPVRLAAWAVLTLAGVLALVWARRRSVPLVVLAVGGGPLLLAVLWNVSESLVALLPNTL